MDSNFRNNLYCLESYQIFCLFYYYEINTKCRKKIEN